MRLSAAIAQFLKKVEVESAPQTVKGYRSDLTRFLMLVRKDTVLHVTPELIQKFFTDQSEAGNSMATLHRRRASLAEFLRFGAKIGLWPLELITHLPKIRQPARVPKPFSREETARLLGLSLPPREALIRSLLFYSGLRVGAICGLKAGDIGLEPPVLRTIGKGAKTQVLPLHPILQAELLDYVAARPEMRAHHFLVGHKDGRPIRTLTVWSMTKRWADCGRADYHSKVERCDLCAQVVKCHPHRFRHSYATRLLEQTGNVRLVQEALGHADISTTQVYMQVTQAGLADALRGLEFPR